MYIKSTRERFFPDLYFDAGGRRIDYVIVYSLQQILESEYKRNCLANFIDFLNSRDISLEHSYHTKNPDIGFIKVHVPQETLEAYADALNIDLTYKMNPAPIVSRFPKSKCRRTPLSYPDERSIVFRRAKQTIGGRPHALTQAERILLTHIILQEVQFGVKLEDKGLGTLQAKKIVKDSFALHEGPPNLTPHGPLTDRQLLAAYWAHVRNILKEQPTDIIHKYFGPNVAFYFTFIAFFNYMLIPASAAALGLTLGSYVLSYQEIKRLQDIYCKSNIYFCPVCDPVHCKMYPLSNFCQFFSVMYLYDNVGCLFLSLFMSLWGTVFFELWDRKRNLLLIKWHLDRMESDITTRIEYEKNCDVLVVSPVTGLMEPTMSGFSVTWRYGVIILIMMFLVSIILYMMALCIYVRLVFYKYALIYIKNPFFSNNRRLLLDSFAVLLQVFFMVLVDKIKHPVVRFMADLENCRTEIEYNNSFIVKLWLISMVNVYSVVFYTAFIKGSFFTNPGDPTLYKDKNALKADICSPPGCNQDLFHIILFIIIFKTLFVKCVGKIIYPIVKRSCVKKQLTTSSRVPQWEKDYLLEKVRDIDLVESFSETVGRFSMVLFMTSICPIAPLITLVCNRLEERIDAKGYLETKRRSIPRKVTGLGAWYIILKFITLFSILMNALTTAFTKTYLSFLYYGYTHENSTEIDFIHSRFSDFAVKDFPVGRLKDDDENITTCAYNMAYRYPPDHEKKYQRSPEGYPFLAFQLGCVVLFQHIIFVLNYFITKLIPNTTTAVQEYLEKQASDERKMIRNHRNLEYMRSQMSRSSSRKVKLK